MAPLMDVNLQLGLLSIIVLDMKQKGTYNGPVCKKKKIFKDTFLLGIKQFFDRVLCFCIEIFNSFNNLMMVQLTEAFYCALKISLKYFSF